MASPWTLRRCEDHKNKNKKLNAAEGEVGDRVSELPIEIVLIILSSFTMKEAARLSLVSHKWDLIFRCFHHLNFEDLRAMGRISESAKVAFYERSNFVNHVDKVLGKYLGPVVDEFRVSFDMDKSFQSHVEKWVTFALEKQVKKLELDFTSKRGCMSTEQNRCTLLLHMPLNLVTIKSSLTSLCLKYVNVTQQVICCLLSTCVFLQHVCIEGSAHLTRLRIPHSLLCLKHLEVSHCRKLRRISLSAPKLLSFTHYGHPLKLDIRDANSFSGLSIGCVDKVHHIGYVFESFSDYFSQLEYLSLRICLWNQRNMEIDQPHVFANLKHLELCVIARYNQSLLGWTSLIVASPVLKKLTLKLNSYISDDTSARSRPMFKKVGYPLKSLKTIEIFGYIGRPVDLELTTFLLENALSLEEVVVDYVPLFSSTPHNDGGQRRLVDLLTKIPPNVRLIVK